MFVDHLLRIKNFLKNNLIHLLTKISPLKIWFLLNSEFQLLCRLCNEFGMVCDLEYCDPDYTFEDKVSEQYTDEEPLHSVEI